MAGDLTTHVYEVRRLIGDRRKGDPVVTDALIEELTDATIDELMDEIGAGTIKTASFATLVPGTMTYTLTIPSSIPSILHLENLVLDSTGYPLEKRDLDWLLVMRVNNSDAKGTPRYYAIRESNAQVTTLEIYPSPSENDTLTAYWQPIHRRVMLAGSTTTTTTELSFTKPGLTALRIRVAGKVLMALDAASLARLNPPKSAAFGESLVQQSVQLVEAEFFRLHQGEFVDTVQRTR